MKSTIRLLIVTGVFLSSFVTLASTTWVPISGDITIFIPYEPSEPFEAPVNIQKSENGGVSTLTWDDVEHASQFEIQGLNAQGVWVTILVTTDNFVVLDERFSDYSQIRIAACTYSSCSFGQYTEVYIRVNKSVIFIHTDLLGSPIVETDENGEVQ